MTVRLGGPPGPSPLESASARRADVERAVGLVMATERCGAGLALDILHQRADLAQQSTSAFAFAVVAAAGVGPPPSDATPRW
jgi:hypothetical protein